MAEALKHFDEDWDNKTSVFQSRIDLKVLAEVETILDDHFDISPRSVSALIKNALYILVQIGRKNGWSREFKSYRESWIHLNQKGLYAFNKADRARESITDRISREDIKEPRVYRHDVDKAAATVDSIGKDKQVEKLDMISKTKEEMLEALREQGSLYEGDIDETSE